MCPEALRLPRRIYLLVYNSTYLSSPLGDLAQRHDWTSRRVHEIRQRTSPRPTKSSSFLRLRFLRFFHLFAQLARCENDIIEEGVPAARRSKCKRVVHIFAIFCRRRFIFGRRIQRWRLQRKRIYRFRQRLRHAFRVCR